MTATRGAVWDSPLQMDRSDILRIAQGSWLAALPPETTDRLLRAAATVAVPAGRSMHRQGNEPWLALVLDGVARVYVESADGRQATLRYAREGAVLGLAATLGGSMPANVQAVDDVLLLRLDVEQVQRCCQSDASAAYALAQEMARLVVEVVQERAQVDFASVQQRVVHHLLDLATRDRQGGTDLVAHVTHQQLADAAGTVREVVARALQSLRREGLVSSVPGGVRLDDPAGLHRATWTA